jgi:hypothetical protein
VLIFVETKKGCDQLTRSLRHQGQECRWLLLQLRNKLLSAYCIIESCTYISSA